MQMLWHDLLVSVNLLYPLHAASYVLDAIARAHLHGGGRHYLH